jgi:hypothetical protein
VPSSSIVLPRVPLECAYFPGACVDNRAIDEDAARWGVEDNVEAGPLAPALVPPVELRDPSFVLNRDLEVALDPRTKKGDQGIVPRERRPPNRARDEMVTEIVSKSSPAALASGRLPPGAPVKQAATKCGAESAWRQVGNALRRRPKIGASTRATSSAKNSPLVGKEATMETSEGRFMDGSGKFLLAARDSQPPKMAPAARLQDAPLAPYVAFCSGHSLAPPRHPGDDALEGEDAQTLRDLERVLFGSSEEGDRRAGCRRVDTEAAVPEGTRDNSSCGPGGLGGVGEARDVVDDLGGDGVELRPKRRAGRPRAKEVGNCRPEPRRGEREGVSLMKTMLDKV